MFTDKKKEETKLFKLIEKKKLKLVGHYLRRNRLIANILELKLVTEERKRLTVGEICGWHNYGDGCVD